MYLSKETCFHFTVVLLNSALSQGPLLGGLSQELIRELGHNHSLQHPSLQHLEKESGVFTHCCLSPIT